VWHKTSSAPTGFNPGLQQHHVWWHELQYISNHHWLILATSSVIALTFWTLIKTHLSDGERWKKHPKLRYYFPLSNKFLYHMCEMNSFALASEDDHSECAEKKNVRQRCKHTYEDDDKATQDTWIVCDNCWRWFHFTCVGLMVTPAKEEYWHSWQCKMWTSLNLLIDHRNACKLI
jgi:hypothetical protein